MPIYKYNNKLLDFSRQNKKHQTEAEKKLWFHIRNRQVGGYKFRRQFPIAQYILDFYCDEKKLALELDGSQHIGSTYDEKRDLFLKNRGIDVMRILDNELFQNIDGVLETIRIKLIR